MRQIMRVQDALQDMMSRTRQADALKLGAQDVDRTTVQRFEGMSARDGALFHERFLGREERRVEFALGRGERAVHGECTCCGSVAIEWMDGRVLEEEWG
jgi:hypothetical protein